MYFMNDPADVTWLREVHLKGRPEADLPFLSFVLTGNEDAPSSVELYSDHNPGYLAHPIATIVFWE